MNWRERRKKMETMLTKHFSLEELTASATAKRLNICNAPDAEGIDSLKRLCETVLEPVRVRYGKPIIVTSGYRSEKLNKAVGGAKNSDHLYCSASDLRSVAGTKEENIKLFKLIVQMARDGEIECRQIILEAGGAWIHCSINNRFNKTKINEVLYL